MVYARHANDSYSFVLKLTLPGHYGIKFAFSLHYVTCSEVDPTGSLWYIFSVLYRAGKFVLKLTLPGHYGIEHNGGPDKTRRF